MTPEEQRIKIAQACGWKPDTRGFGWLDPHGCYSPEPDYLNDLNAMHEAEKVGLKLTGPWIRYVKQLGFIFMRDLNGKGTWEMHCQRDEDGLTHAMINFVAATAAQRAEAFLRTLNLWED